MPDTLYDELVANRCRIDHHESDLYVKATSDALAIITRHDQPIKYWFTSDIDGERWVDIPFAYTPFWRERAAR